MKRYPRIRIAICSISLFSMTACGTLGTQVTAMKVDPTDICDSYRDPLRRLHSGYKKQVGTGMLAGAVTGALIGLFSSKENRGRNAAIGAAAGAAVGGAVGSQVAEGKAAKDREAILSELDTNLETDRARVTNAADSIKGMAQCRRDQYTALRLQLEAEEITSGEGLTQKAVIDNAVFNDRELITAVLGSAGKRYQEYRTEQNQISIRLIENRYSVAASGLTLLDKPATDGTMITRYREGDELVGVALTDPEGWVYLTDKVAGIGGYAPGESLVMVEEAAAPEQFDKIEEYGRQFGELQTFTEEQNQEVDKEREALDALVLGSSASG